MPTETVLVIGKYEMFIAWTACAVFAITLPGEGSVRRAGVAADVSYLV